MFVDVCWLQIRPPSSTACTPSGDQAHVAQAVRARTRPRRPRHRRGPCGAPFAAALAAALAPLATAQSVSGCDLSVPEYAMFLQRVRAFYGAGIFEGGDVERVNSFLQNREALLLLCPVAVLQALLVKLEENLVYEPRAYQELMAEYARYMHAAILQGSLHRADLEEWPLAEGIERTVAVSKALAVGRNLSSAMVLNFCQPEDRFGTVHGLSWLLEPPFGEHRPDDVGDTGLLLDTDLYIYLVDAPHCKDLNPELVAQLEKVTRRVHQVPYTGGPSREEQTAYFKFIVDHYDNLPDFTIFVHPDAPEHQGVEFPALRRALKAVRTQSAFAQGAIGYYALAQQMVVDPKRTWGERFAPSWRLFWQRLYGRQWRELGFRPPRCRWDAAPGKYISGLAEGTEGRTSRANAKAACARLGDACAGITCGTPLSPEEGGEEVDDNSDDPEKTAEWLYSGRGSCTARLGEPPGLLPSPTEEMSYAKFCAPETEDFSLQGTAHEDALTPESEGTMQAATYLKHSDAYLPGYAAEDEEVRDTRASRDRCDELGDACSGFTCDAGGSPCTVRAGASLVKSPAGEVSYRKKAAEPRPGLTTRDGATTLFQFYTGSQSVVRKDRILAWSRDEYATFMADGPFCSEFTGYFEAVWHAMFGEPMSQWPREHDPSLPLYLKWSVLSLYSYGDEGVV